MVATDLDRDRRGCSCGYVAGKPVFVPARHLAVQFQLQSVLAHGVCDGYRLRFCSQGVTVDFLLNQLNTTRWIDAQDSVRSCRRWCGLRFWVVR